MALVRLVTSLSTNGVDVASYSGESCNRLTPVATSAGEGHEEGGSPTVPHLVDRLAASLNADGVDSESNAM